MSNVTSDIPLSAGHDGSWSRQGQTPSVDVLKDVKYRPGEREVSAMDAAYKRDGDGENDMVKDEVSSSSDDDGEDEEDEEDDNDDSLYPEEPTEGDGDDENQNQRHDAKNNEAVSENKLNDEFRRSDATSVEESAHFGHPSQNTEGHSNEQLKIDNPKMNDPEMSYPTEMNNRETVQTPSNQQEVLPRQTKGTHSSEQIPKSHQTLKMRLKLRAPIIQDHSEEVVIIQKPGKRKRGRPPVQIKKEPRKFLQISLGNQADRWQEVKNLAGGLKFHSQVAKLLLDCFDAMLDGSLQWSSESADSDLKSKLHKMFADKKLALPNDSWLPVAKSKKKSSITLAPPKKIVYKEDSQEELEDFDNQDEFADNSADEDYQPVKTIPRSAKRSQPKRRKQSTPRRVVVAAENQGENKKVKPLKVTLTRDYTGDRAEDDFAKVKHASGKSKKGRRRSSDQAKSPPAQKSPAIPPEFASYPKVFKCRRCPAKSGITYPTIELLQEHFNTHKLDNVLPKKKYAPNLPPLSPTGEETEDEAIQRMSKVLIRCPDCKKLFFPGRLVQHLRTAHVRVLCEECGGMFSRVAMWEHKKAHRFKAQGKKPYKCDKCNKEFLWQVSLRQHRELHSKERPFICSACGKSFKTLTKMKRHEIIHEAVKPYTCPHCRRSFTQRTNLKTHIRTHTGEKPYKCEYCAKTFTHKVSMKTHMKKEHGVDLWRDGPPHRVQEFDDVRCQMKRRKNPQTQSIQKSVIVPETKVEIPAGVAQELVVKEMLDDRKELHPEEHRGFREESREYHEQRGLIEESKRLMEEQRGLREGHRLIEDGRVISDDHRVLDPRSQVVTESPHEMVEISISDRQHAKTSEDPHGLDHHNSEHQMQNCISPTEPQCETVPVPIVEDAQPQQHDMQRSAHESMHYTPHYLPTSTDMTHISQHMPSSNTSHDHPASRYPSSQDGISSRYPHMSAMHPDIRQGSLHHDLQQGAAMHLPVTHPRYPSWAPPQAGGPQGYIPGEMGPAILSELMKLGK